jgi:hypothetical protein
MKELPKIVKVIPAKFKLQHKEKGMKKVIMFLAVLAVASVGVVGSAQAQADATEIANVPFDFYAGGQKMPAGKYTVGIDLEGERITLRDATGRHQMFLMGIPEDDANDNPELLFEHSGDVYALSGVNSDLIDLGFRTKVPKEAMASRTSSQVVEVALNR